MKNRYEIFGDKAHIYLDRRDAESLTAVVDVCDLPLVAEIPGKWQAHYTKAGVYVKARVPGASTRDGKVYLHRHILKPNNELVVDHKDRNPLNNTRDNMRIVTQHENLQNKSMTRKNTSGFKNVRWHKLAKKWQAYGRINGEFKSYGLYVDIEDAAKAAGN